MSALRTEVSIGLGAEGERGPRAPKLRIASLLVLVIVLMTAVPVSAHGSATGQSVFCYKVGSTISVELRNPRLSGWSGDAWLATGVWSQASGWLGWKVRGDLYNFYWQRWLAGDAYLTANGFTRYTSLHDFNDTTPTSADYYWVYQYIWWGDGHRTAFYSAPCRV